MNCSRNPRQNLDEMLVFPKISTPLDYSSSSSLHPSLEGVRFEMHERGQARSGALLCLTFSRYDLAVSSSTRHSGNGDSCGLIRAWACIGVASPDILVGQHSGTGKC